MGANRSPISGLLAPFRRDQSAEPDDSRTQQRGQVLPIFAIMAVVLLGGAALITDVAWWWTNEQRMQRAADAAALAGAAYLPGNEAKAFLAAREEATKNGYTGGVQGITVVPRRDLTNPRKLIVDVDGQVRTNFARVFCWQGGPCLDRVDVGVTGAAEMVLPVPMGSPQNYYGVGFFKDAVTTTTNTPRTGTIVTRSPTASVSGGQWSNPGNAFGGGNTTENSNGDAQSWRGFDFSSLPADATITGIRVMLSNATLTGNGNPNNDCRVTARLSWDGGTSLSDPVQSAPLTTGAANRNIPQTTGTAVWGTHPWVRSDFVPVSGQSPFQVRLIWVDGNGNNSTGCNANRSVSIDEIDVELTYDWTESITTTTIQEEPVRAPDSGSTVLAPQNFWGALQSQGAPNIQGDAYMTYYDTRTSATNGDYSAGGYYQYGIEFAPGTSGREVWVFDPGFCDVSSANGTGEYYTMGAPNGTNSFNPVSTYYDLYNTKETPWDLADDGAPVAGFDDDYERLSLRDTALTGNISGTSPCDDLTWHHGWVRLDGDLSVGNKFRLHTYSTDPDSANDQRNSTALNAFAIWTTSSGTAPRVYGLGAMEAYVKLPGGRASEFYLARIDEEHAGKTMVINLWDPGDTGSLAANLQILAPGATNYSAVPFAYTARANSGNATNCNNRNNTNDGVADDMSVVTNTGGTSLYNGCWLTIEIALDPNYTAPHPSTDTVTTEGGWWKIRYNMSGSASSNSTDLTTWQVELRGNPVHLVPE